MSDESEEVITGHVLLEESDVRRGLEDSLRHALLYFVAVIALLVAIAVARSAKSESSYMEYVAIAFLFVVGVAFMRGPRRFAKQFIESKRAEELDITYAFDANGFTIKTGASELRAAWSALYRYKEGRSTFLLFDNPKVHQIVPKRAFRPDDVSKLSALLKAHVQDPAQKKQYPLRRAGILWVVLLCVFAAVYALAKCGRPLDSPSASIPFSLDFSFTPEDLIARGSQETQARAAAESVSIDSRDCCAHPATCGRALHLRRSPHRRTTLSSGVRTRTHTR